MPFSTIVIVSLIAGAFLVFALTLAYGEYQTRNIKQASESPADEQEWRKAA